jgi:RNA recognition motif-containing protein
MRKALETTNRYALRGLALSCTQVLQSVSRSSRRERVRKGGDIRMSKTLYVGNLPWATTEEELKAVFSEHAEVVGVRIITDRETGRSKGFGFVEINEDALEKTISEMNGYNLNGRQLVVNEARPRSGRD